MKRIVVASASPRRSELLANLGLDFNVMPSNIDEDNIIANGPSELVEKLSFEKAMSIAKKVDDDALVVGADTVVFYGEIMGKPKNEEDAFKTLKKLQGKCHEVLTGVTVVETKTLKYETAYEKTCVHMRELTDEQIWSYIKTGEPMDKAGAYGIQGLGSILVERIEGCYFNVVGLPLQRFNKILEKFEQRLL